MWDDSHVESFNVCDKEISLVLIRDEKDAAGLIQQVLSGINVALIKPTLYCGAPQVLSAAQRALEASSRGRLVTKNVITELLFNISTSKNISASLKTFGSSPQDTDILLVDMGGLHLIKKFLTGKTVPLTTELMDEEEIRKIYNIKGEEINFKILDSVVTRIATKAL